MGREFRRRFWVETVSATATGLLTVLSLLWRGWIEVIFRVDPDGGSGALEWTVVVGLACATVAAGLLARVELRRTPAAAGSG